MSICFACHQPGATPGLDSIYCPQCGTVPRPLAPGDFVARFPKGKREFGRILKVDRGSALARWERTGSEWEPLENVLLWGSDHWELRSLAQPAVNLNRGMPHVG